MERAITLTTLIFIWIALLDICAADTQTSLLARHRKPIKLTTKIPLPNKTTLIAPIVDSSNDVNESHKHSSSAFQHTAPETRIIESYDKRSPDGHYEYRYVLSNGDVRYERAYWQPVGHTKVLARKGYYSYPLPNHRFHTVFYTADHNGFREVESFYTRKQPVLPRTLDITAANVTSEKKPLSEKNKDKINSQTQHKPNWAPITMTILQKGRIDAATSQDESRTEASDSGSGSSSTELNSEALTTKTLHSIKISASEVTNRPQINTEGSRQTTKEKEEIPEIINGLTRAISASSKNEAINPITVESEQMSTLANWQAERHEAFDTTTTVLSVD